MKRINLIIGIILLAACTLMADIGIAGKEKMIAEAELIAFVDIMDLFTINRKESHSDLIATAFVEEVLKGEAEGEFKFRILRFFPDAAFDVSTGKHLVFLKKNTVGRYVGVNWYMSYLYMAGNTAKWYGPQGLVIDTATPDQIIRDLKSLLKKPTKK